MNPPPQCIETFKNELREFLLKWNAEILAVKDAWDQESIAIWATDSETGCEFRIHCGVCVNSDNIPKPPETSAE